MADEIDHDHRGHARGDHGRLEDAARLIVRHDWELGNVGTDRGQRRHAGDDQQPSLLPLDEGMDPVVVHRRVGPGQHIHRVGGEQLIGTGIEPGHGGRAGRPVLQHCQPGQVDHRHCRQDRHGTVGGAPHELPEQGEHQIELHGHQQEVEVVLGGAGHQVVAEVAPRPPVGGGITHRLVDHAPGQVGDEYQGEPLPPERPGRDRAAEGGVDQDKGGQGKEDLPAELEEHQRPVGPGGEGNPGVADGVHPDHRGKRQEPQDVDLPEVRARAFVRHADVLTDQPGRVLRLTRRSGHGEGHAYSYFSRLGVS